MLSKEGIYELLENSGVEFEVFEHKPVFSIDEMYAQNLPNQELIVKNLFLRDDKKQCFFLVVMRADKNVNIKELRRKLKSRPLSFASKELLEETLCVGQGHVTPLALLNNDKKNVVLVLDEELQGQRIGVHPLKNDATIFLEFDDVLRLIISKASDVKLCDF